MWFMSILSFFFQAISATKKNIYTDCYPSCLDNCNNSRSDPAHSFTAGLFHVLCLVSEKQITENFRVSYLPEFKTISLLEILFTYISTRFRNHPFIGYTCKRNLSQYIQNLEVYQGANQTFSSSVGLVVLFVQSSPIIAVDRTSAEKASKKYSPTRPSSSQANQLLNRVQITMGSLQLWWWPSTSRKIARTACIYNVIFKINSK